MTLADQIGGVDASQLLQDGAVQDPDSRRWIRVGTSSNPDPDQIVTEALAPILAMGAPALAVIFCSPAHDLAAIVGDER